MSTATILPFSELASLEPRLAQLLARVQAMRDGGGDHFCADEAWAGYGDFPGVGIKHELNGIVGWDRREAHPVLSSCEAYETACRTVWEALPDCRNCGCWVIPIPSQV